VLGIPGEDRPQVWFTEDQHSVGHLGPGGEHEPLRKSVRAGTSGWDLHRLDIGAGQGRVERCGELPGPVADQEPEAGGVVAEVHQEIADLLGGPRPIRVCGDPGDVHVAGADLDHEQAVQALDGHRAVDVKKSAASIVAACACRNRRQVVSVCRFGAGGICRSLRTRRIVEAPTR
jgi:hypothetical protein